MVDKLARRKPDKLAMLHVDKHKVERYFTFSDMRRYSNRAANYFQSLGIKRGDRVMLILKRHYQFWFAILGLHKLGAIAMPASNQMLTHDLEYRFQAAGVTAMVCHRQTAITAPRGGRRRRRPASRSLPRSWWAAPGGLARLRRGVPPLQRRVRPLRGEHPAART